MNQSPHINYFIDASLKNFDKDLYRHIDSYMQEKKLIPLERINDDQKSILSVYILFDTEVDPNIIRTDDVILKFSGANLDFFSHAATESVSYFEVESFEDFCQTWKLIQTFLDIKLKKKEEEIFESSLKKIKKDVSKKELGEILRSAPSLEIQSFERSLYEISIEEMSIDRVNILLKSHFHGEISLLNSLDEFDANETFLGIQTFDEKISFLKTSELNQNFFRSYIILYEYFEGINTLFQSQQAFENWSDIIHYIDIPLLMYDQAGHPVIHNSSFVKLSLSIKECLEVKDNAQIHIDGKLFRVVREPLEKDLTVMLFFPVEEFLTSTMGKTKSEELGIITSSIAHELNNPLGGILAAIDVNLLDEEDQESEVSQRLEEMKLGVKRCKKLVETFLGFSRGKAQDISSQKNSFSVKDAVTQALDLIRFRLVENNISMNLDYSKKGDFKKEINPYILSMVFYLTYGALVTELSHYHLVSGSSSLKVDLNILESKDQIMMTVNEKLGNIESVFNSKLLAHLLELLELEFQHKNNVFFLKAI